MTLFTLLYTLQKKRIVTHNIRKVWVCILIGMCLGGLSAFLGIGGGPLNLVVLYYFFSMTTREATENSLYVIFVSQCMSLFVSIVSRSVPVFASLILVFMVLGGIAGGMAGRSISQRIQDSTVEKLFVILMVVMIGICGYNIYQF